MWSHNPHAHLFGSGYGYRDHNRNQTGLGPLGGGGYDAEMQRVLELSQRTFHEEQDRRLRAKQAAERRLRQIKEEEAASRAQRTRAPVRSALRLPLSEVDACRIFAEVMEWQPKMRSRGAGAGLRNLGNSCFMNATLQCLAYSPSFAQLLMSARHTHSCKVPRGSFCALCAVEGLVPSMVTTKELQKPHQLFKHLPTVNDMLSPGCQEDAHELLLPLLDKMEQAYDKAAHGGKDPHNPIRELFTGQLKTTIACGGCRRESVTHEPFYNLSLDLADSLEESLTIFSQDEVLRDEDRYFCDHCNRKRVARKRVTISALPPLLVFHVKRFKVQQTSGVWEPTAMKMTKLMDPLEFPDTIDFAQSCHISEEDLAANQDWTYQLYAVLVHAGPKLGCGHYYAMVRAPNNKWYRMNDSEVQSVSTAQVLKEQGYLLFYKRTTHKTLATRLQGLQAPAGAPAAAAALVPTPAAAVATTPAVSSPREASASPMITDDYFHSAPCGAATAGGPAVHPTAAESTNLMASAIHVPTLGATYHHVLGIATRPEEAPAHATQDTPHPTDGQKYEEVFWPEKEMPDGQL